MTRTTAVIQFDLLSVLKWMDLYKGRRHKFQKGVRLYVSLWENDPVFSPAPQFMVSIASFKSSSTQHDVHLINDGAILTKVDTEFLSSTWQPLNLKKRSILAPKNRNGDDRDVKLEVHHSLQQFVKLGLNKYIKQMWKLLVSWWAMGLRDTDEEGTSCTNLSTLE